MVLIYILIILRPLTSFLFCIRKPKTTVCLCECECVCVCVRERERERELLGLQFAAVETKEVKRRPPQATSIHLLLSIIFLFILLALLAIMADETPNDLKEEVPDLAPFDPTKKKKKKKVVIQDAVDDPVDKLAEKTEALSVSDGMESTFTGLKKKKKKPVETDILNEEIEDAGEDIEEHAVDDEEEEGNVLQQRYPWEGSDRDYHYEELLGRVFNILRENNPELAGDRRRTVMRPPQVLREGTKKTVFVNFMDLCKTMHRQPDHVMAFLLAELGTSGSLDGQQRLVVKGRFAPKNFEGILRRYVNEYVICLGCKSPDTILSKENRLFFLRCEKCGSGRSVAPIKAGFVARVGRRNAAT